MVINTRKMITPDINITDTGMRIFQGLGYFRLEPELFNIFSIIDQCPTIYTFPITNPNIITELNKKTINQFSFFISNDNPDNVFLIYMFCK